MTEPTKAFACAGADIPVTPEEDAYFQEMERKAQPTVQGPPAKAMTYDEYDLHCRMLRGTSFSGRGCDHSF